MAARTAKTRSGVHGTTRLVSTVGGRTERAAHGLRGRCLSSTAALNEARPGFPEEVSRARRWTRDILAGSPLAEDAELIVSELSANAVLHTASGQHQSVDIRH
jgi:hypothetical protein